MSENSSIETFFEQNAVDGVLGEEAMVKLLTGDMGDNTAGEAPEPAQDGGVKPEQQPADNQSAGEGKPEEAAAEGEGDDPVIVAKDGKNIIPYDKLVEARNEAKAAKEANQALMQEMESIKEQIANLNANKQDEQQQEVKPESVDVSALEREWHEAMLDDDPEKAIEIRGKINAELKRQALEEAKADYQSRREAEVKQQEQLSAQQLLDQAAADVVKDYPELDLESESVNREKVAEVVEYRDFLITSKGTPPHEALKTAAQRIMGAPVKQAGGDTPAPGEKKQQAINPSVKERTPTTMSDIPAGTAVHADEAEAFMQMSSAAQLGKFMNMDPEKIEQLIGRMV